MESYVFVYYMIRNYVH